MKIYFENVQAEKKTKLEKVRKIGNFITRRNELLLKWKTSITWRKVQCLMWNLNSHNIIYKYENTKTE